MRSRSSCAQWRKCVGILREIESTAHIARTRLANSLSLTARTWSRSARWRSVRWTWLCSHTLQQRRKAWSETEINLRLSLLAQALPSPCVALALALVHVAMETPCNRHRNMLSVRLLLALCSNLLCCLYYGCKHCVNMQSYCLRVLCYLFFTIVSFDLL